MASCDRICIGEYVFLLLWLISVPIYCMVIYAIIRKRKTVFKEEFWLLAISLFIADMLHLCQTMWGTKMASWGYLPSAFMRKPHIFGMLMISPKSALMYAQFMGLIFVSFNRYVAIMKPLEYKAIFTRKKTIWCIYAQWAVASFVFLGNINIRYTLLPNPVNNGSDFTAAIDMRDKKIAGVFMVILMGFGGLIRIPLFAFLYIRMFYEGYKRNSSDNNNNNGTPSLSRAEINLAIMGSLLALCDTAITLHAFDIAIQRRIQGYTIQEMGRYHKFRLGCITDVYGWINGWLLLACCQEVREQFLRLFCCKKPNQVQPAQNQNRNNNVNTSRL